MIKIVKILACLVCFFLYANIVYSITPCEADAKKCKSGEDTPWKYGHYDVLCDYAAKFTGRYYLEKGSTHILNLLDKEFIWNNKYPSHVKEAKRRGLSCAVKAKYNSHLYKAFKSIDNRKLIQSTLKSYQFYSGKIDGLYGPNTKAAIESYAKSIGKEDHLKSEKLAKELLQSLIFTSEDQDTDESKIKKGLF